MGAFDADVQVAKVGSGRPPVSARSLTNLVALGARLGDRVHVLASGPQAREAVGALQELAATGFGDGVQAPAPGTVLQGVAAAAGVATGPAHQLGSSSMRAAARASGTPEQELALLDRAIATARAALGVDREQLRARAGDAEAGIFDAHLALLEDEALLEPLGRRSPAGRMPSRPSARPPRRLPTSTERYRTRCWPSGRRTSSTSATGSPGDHWGRSGVADRRAGS